MLYLPFQILNILFSIVFFFVLDTIGGQKLPSNRCPCQPPFGLRETKNPDAITCGIGFDVSKRPAID